MPTMVNLAFSKKEMNSWIRSLFAARTFVLLFIVNILCITCLKGTMSVNFLASRAGSFDFSSDFSKVVL